VTSLFSAPSLQSENRHTAIVKYIKPFNAQAAPTNSNGSRTKRSFTTNQWIQLALCYKSILRFLATKVRVPSASDNQIRKARTVYR
jgi:hypothetical protein